MARDRTPRDAFGRPLPPPSSEAATPAPPATVEEALRAPRDPGSQPPPARTPTPGTGAPRVPVSPATPAAPVAPATPSPRTVTPPDARPERRWEDPAAAPVAADGPTAAPASNPVAIAAFVAGLSSFVLVPFLLSVAAIVLGTMGVRAADRVPGTPGRTLANVGRILGWVSLAMWAVGALAFALLVRDLAVP